MLLERVLKQLKEEKRRIESYVSGGQVQDFASYRFFVGQIKGLQDSIEICRNAFKGEISDDDKR